MGARQTSDNNFSSLRYKIEISPTSSACFLLHRDKEFYDKVAHKQGYNIQWKEN